MNTSFRSALIGVVLALFTTSVVAAPVCKNKHLDGSWQVYMNNHDFNQNASWNFFCDFVVETRGHVNSALSVCRFTTTGFVWQEAVGGTSLSVTPTCEVIGNFSPWLEIVDAQMNVDKDSISGVGIHLNEDTNDGQIEWEFNFTAVKQQ